MFIYVLSTKRILKTLRYCVIILLITGLINVSIVCAQGRFDYTSFVSNEPIKVIIIDAGHGGEDPGAIGVTGKYEKDLNLEISMIIGEELKNMGYTVIYTRTQDKLLYLPEENIKGMRKISDLKNRCKITFEYDDPILISVHMNSYGASKYSGLQVYYSDGNEESMSLAHKIQYAVKSNLQTNNNRQIKNGKDIYLLKNSNGNAVLIECGFLSNNEECEKLSQKEYQKELSFAIIYGIIEYINETEGSA